MASNPMRTVNSSMLEPGQIASRTFVSMIHSKCGMRSGSSLRNTRMTRSAEDSSLIIPLASIAPTGYLGWGRVAVKFSVAINIQAKIA